MDISMALDRVKEIQDEKKRIQGHLKYIDLGYTMDTQKNYRVRFDLPETIRNGNQVNDDLPASHNANIRLDEVTVKQLLEKELSEFNAELEVLSPVIDAANAMLREAIEQRN